MEHVDVFAALGVALASAGLGFVKKYTTLLDNKLGAVVKPVQPLVIAAAGVALPWLSTYVDVGGLSAETLVTAPTSALLVVAAREATQRIQGKK